MLQTLKNKVAVITGAGSGLGRSYALQLAQQGAKVVVNNRISQPDQQPKADEVVETIRKLGGEAVPNYDSISNGESIIKTALDHYGTVDILINNAGIIKDRSLKKMTQEEWNQVCQINLNDTFTVTKAAWIVMQANHYGKIINTGSASGLYGNIGQANYSTTKLGIHAFTLSLALEGSSHNIHVNTICPMALSQMTAKVFNKNDDMKPEYVAPFVAYLVSDQCTEQGSIFEIAGGFISKLRWERTRGHHFAPQELTNDNIHALWDKITDWGDSTHPSHLKDTLELIMKSNTNTNRMMI